MLVLMDGKQGGAFVEYLSLTVSCNCIKVFIRWWRSSDMLMRYSHQKVRSKC